NPLRPLFTTVMRLEPLLRRLFLHGLLLGLESRFPLGLRRGFRNRIDGFRRLVHFRARGHCCRLGLPRFFLSLETGLLLSLGRRLWNRIGGLGLLVHRRTGRWHVGRFLLQRLLLGFELRRARFGGRAGLCLLF